MSLLRRAPRREFLSPPGTPSPWSFVPSFVLVGMGYAALAAFLGGVRATPLVLGLIVLACALCGLHVLARRLVFLGSAVVALVLAAALFTPMLRPVLNALVLSEAPRRADAIVVLGAGVNCGDGTLDASSNARLLRALELWRAGFAPVLTVSEQSYVFNPPSCPRISTLAANQIRALYPREREAPRVLVLSRVTTTRDEADRVAAFARERGWDRVLIVTSPTHSRRATLLMRSVGVNAVSVPAWEPTFDTALPLPADRIMALRLVVYEGLSRLKALLTERS